MSSHHSLSSSQSILYSPSLLILFNSPLLFMFFSYGHPQFLL
ncbi:hypothetical protein SOVF_062610 [Spinacia oleracea]|nr:hypothetical protein SOVF_062610 [Spinacia oleracea]